MGGPECGEIFCNICGKKESESTLVNNSSVIVSKTANCISCDSGTIIETDFTVTILDLYSHGQTSQEWFLASFNGWHNFFGVVSAIFAASVGQQETGIAAFASAASAIIPHTESMGKTVIHRMAMEIKKRI